MPRLIILLLILAALAILAVQNLSTPLSLVILGSARTPEIPFGLLLLGAVCTGALITLILYGLIGLRRPPESKYRPIGRRVPYPDMPGSTTLPNSGPPYSPAGAAAAPSYGTASSSTAFVSEPPPPQDAPRQESAPPPFTVDPIEDKTEKKKSRFSRQADPLEGPLEGYSEPSVEGRRMGDDWGNEWGEVRTAKQRDSWNTESDADRTSGMAGAKQSLFDFMGINPTRKSASRSYEGDRDIDDLDRGWENFQGYGNSSPPLETPVETPVETPEDSDKRVYRDGLYGDDIGPQSDYPDEGYEDDYYEDDSVYEADYRVIVPPSQPLDDGEDEYPNRRV